MYLMSRDEDDDWFVVSCGESYDTIIAHDLTKNQAANLVHFLNGGTLIGAVIIQTLLHDGGED